MMYANHVSYRQGVLSGAVSWKELQEQYSKDLNVYKNELTPLIKSPEEVSLLLSLIILRLILHLIFMNYIIFNNYFM